jgi:hypothetical protein
LINSLRSSLPTADITAKVRGPLYFAESDPTLPAPFPLKKEEAANQACDHIIKNRLILGFLASL